jgi:thiol-disulfide isomerase/thioredoxin
MKELPDNLEFFTLESREKFKIKELLNNGDKIVIHFWATWCGPCEVEFPELIELTHQLQSYKGVKFLLVAINDDLVKVKKFLKKFDVSNENIILLLDEKNEYQRLGTYKLPETFVFNSDSKIIKKFSGQQPWTQKYLVSFFKSL